MACPSSGRALIGFVAGALVLGAPPAARAHHGTSTTRVGGLGGFQRIATRRDALPPPRADGALVHDFSFFDRVLEGAEGYDQADLGAVVVTTLSPTFRLLLDTGTSVGLRVPIGISVASPAEGDAQTLAGLGDLQLSAAQELTALWDRERDLPLAVSVRVGMVAPTGRYEPDVGFSVTDVSGSSEGTIDLITYNTRATLGAGVWSLVGALELDWDVVDRLSLTATGQLVQPFTRTSDDIFWGLDAEVALYTSFAVLPGRFRVGLGADYRYHGLDEIPVEDEVTGALVRDAVGGRDEVGLGLGVEARFTNRLGCSVRGHVPVWQRVGGVQLVETFSVTTGCAYAVEL